MQKKIISTILVMILITVLSLPVLAAGQVNDIKGHWAETEINELLSKNILSTYNNGNFKPNQPITRAEFASGLARALNLPPIGVTTLTDIQSHKSKGYIAALVRDEIITGYPDNTFKPEKEITRAELVTMLMRALELNKMETEIKLNKSYYPDMTVKHWANNAVNLSSYLDIISGYPDGTFKPNDFVTRAETAKMLDSFLNLKVIKGRLVEKYPLSKKIQVTKLDDSKVTLSLANQPLMGRNKRLINLEGLRRHDNLHVIVNKANEIKYLKAYGIVTEDDLALEVSEMTNGTFDPNEIKKLSKGDTKVIESKIQTEVSDMTQGVLSPSEVQAVAEGDLDTVKPKVRQGIKNELVKQGITPIEAQGLLDTDWNLLQTAGKLRLTEAVSMETGLPVNMTRALFDQNWTEVKKLAELELMQRMAAEIMNSELTS
ncbi:S-layer homology domain-containing protein [Selenihalanaerobacter shriftii]|uniref:S-layer homology domain-containing protein n=1 Tax=Selenihalanaerobacter shriftii TaxID=142842 RepID=A0A1T4KCX8_9FIRM|nr:S-layer homology domain-containing protein [Selenihalanaerobacter shriftii]SJZ40279.1 S-layer homology domain-containing protein [Selenihalanaerobacter shriftii]